MSNVDITALLRSRGFTVVSFRGSRTCVDIVARKGKKLLLVRVVGNVDSLREESVEEFARLARILRADPLIVGERTRYGEIPEGTILWRFGVPVLSPRTFEAFLEGELPKVGILRGKRVVAISGRLLREGRKRMNMSMEELARQVGVSKETIYRYERGGFGEEKIVQAIEKTLGVSIREPIRVEMRQEPPEKVSGPWARLKEIGVPIESFSKAPWDAAASMKERIILSMERGERSVVRLEKGLKVVEMGALVVEQKKELSVPTVRLGELLEVETPKEFMKLLREAKDESGTSFEENSS